MVYEIKYKRRFFYRTLKNLVGHSYMDKTDKLLVYFEDSTMEEIPEWSKCHVLLGESFALFMDRKQKADKNVDNVQPVQG